jgi:hypothetical protein
MERSSIRNVIRKCSVAGIAFALLVCLGCSSKPKERTYQLKPQPQPVDKVITLLKGYRDGKQVGSEVTGLPALITDMNEKSADKVEIVQEAFDKLMADRKNAKQIAAEALKKLEAE